MRAALALFGSGSATRRPSPPSRLRARPLPGAARRSPARAWGRLLRPAVVARPAIAAPVAVTAAPVASAPVAVASSPVTVPVAPLVTPAVPWERRPVLAFCSSVSSMGSDRSRLTLPRSSISRTTTSTLSPRARYVLDPVDTALGVELGDVEQAITTRQDVDEGAELGDVHHLALVDLRRPRPRAGTRWPG